MAIPKLHINNEFSNAISESIKKLLEDKHLYQSILVEISKFDEISNKLLQTYRTEHTIQSFSDEYRNYYNSAHNFLWRLPDPERTMRMAGIPATQGIGSNSLEIIPPTIKTYCHNCKTIYPYNFISGVDIWSSPSIKYIDDDPTVQIFSFSYQCQACKKMPEVFMVRREELKLILSGRSPMEQVEAPKVIPKKHNKFFSDAIIAFNSGQILPGKFLLRTFIEQYVRDFTHNKTSKNTDELFATYGGNLPDDFKNRFPSLQNIYDKLSDHIHNADSTPDLFTQAKDDIVRHFDAKRLYEID